MIEKVIFYDADFLSSFLLINETSFLKKIFSEIIIPYPVFEELTEHRAPKEVKEGIEELKNEDFIKIKHMELESQEYKSYRLIKNGTLHKNSKRLGKGESAALAFAINNEGFLASNNFSDVKYYVDEYKLPLLSAPYILALAVDNEIISKNKASNMWNEMIKENRKIPKNTFSEYYTSLYKEDYYDFGHRLFEK